MKLFFQILFRNYYIAFKRLNKFGSTYIAASEIALSIFTWCVLLAYILYNFYYSYSSKPILDIVIPTVLVIGLILQYVLPDIFERDSFCIDVLENLSKYRFRRKYLNIMIPLIFSFAPLISLFVLCYIFW